MDVTIDAWAHGAAIPEKYAFCKLADPGPIDMSDNRNPAIRWANAPAGTQSFAIVCHDPDVPSSADNVNKEGLTVPADLPRVDFYHWVLVDIPASISEIPEGADSDQVTPRGNAPGATRFGMRGINHYTDWFSGDPDMGGDYGGYDGPCPPWNDEIEHRYFFTVYALDVPTLGLSGRFGGADALQAMGGHVLASGQWMGTFTLNRALRSA
ncbi:MAG: YbhB/YbcL family Raf kinase inhibitor-like protein [Rhodospirillales bacterium]|nr:YbhB/YbcL family Raf kinase inhibitor-like protein [Rhodospirillales bacterium]